MENRELDWTRPSMGRRADLESSSSEEYSVEWLETEESELLRSGIGSGLRDR